jgi:NodT family efflux transporter outer membrane factor (OMF) lipoprotein
MTATTTPTTLATLATLARIGACATACTLILGGCATRPAGEKTVQIKAIGEYGSRETFAAPAGVWPSDAWWTLYGDPQLNQLITEALAGSPSIAVAEARLHRAQAAAQVQRGANGPQISGSTSITEQKQSYNYLSPRDFTPQGWNDYGRASLDFSWELDFWGKNRAALAAATSEANAANADTAQARLTLSTAIASAYAELAHEYAVLETAQSALVIRTKTAELFRNRFDNGLETLGSVRQVEARRSAAEADVLSIEEQLGLQRNRIAALMGAGPDRGLAITRPTMEINRAFALPTELSANLLGRRPDITAARMRAEASAQKIKQARAAFYPNVNLAAFIGVQSLNLDMLMKSGSSTGSVGPAVSLPIFNGGRLRGQLRGAEAEHAEAVANYDRTVIQALQEVADAAVSQRALQPQIVRTGDAVDAARESWRIQNNRYEGGLATYLEVLNAEDYLLSNLRVQADLRSRTLSLDVALIRALGGGYSTSQIN